MSKQHKRLGDLLVEAQLITAEQLEAAIDLQKKSNQMLGATLVQIGAVTEQQLLQTLEQQLGLTLVDLNTQTPDESAVAKVREDIARKYAAIPIDVEGRTLILAMADPLNVAAIEDLRFHTGLFIRPVLASGTQINEAIERFYHIDSSMKEVLDNIITSEENDVVTGLTRTTKATRTRPARSSRAARSCGSRTGCCSAPSSRARATSTSSRSSASCACACASTVCSTRSSGCRSGRRAP
jgi:hypothetical protein